MFPVLIISYNLFPVKLFPMDFHAGIFCFLRIPKSGKEPVFPGLQPSVRTAMLLPGASVFPRIFLYFSKAAYLLNVSVSV